MNELDNGFDLVLQSFDAKMGQAQDASRFKTQQIEENLVKRIENIIKSSMDYKLASFVQEQVAEELLKLSKIGHISAIKGNESPLLNPDQAN